MTVEMVEVADLQTEEHGSVVHLYCCTNTVVFCGEDSTGFEDVGDGDDDPDCPKCVEASKLSCPLCGSMPKEESNG